ncbi:MAG: branched-chain amino acid ABC transporter permease [Clostridia bacterium]|nr:branched-chain amino acid ABC transporter permease [Clostridia bacterium]
MNIMPYLIRGLATGGQFALVAIGYTMVYGILKLINFAHGDLFMVSGMLLIYLVADFPTMPIYFSILIMIVITVVIGYLIEKCAYSPLRQAPRMSVMISAIGVSYLLQNLVAYLTGGISKQFPELPFLSENIRLFGVKDKISVFLSPILAILLTVALVFVINKTKFGMSMRAVSRDFETSQLMGIKINWVISVTFAIGAFLAAAGSLLYFSKNTGINHLAGSTPGIKAFIAAVVGGIGSVPGAVVGALIIGVVESLARAFDLADFADVISFALLIIILVVKPTGLFGEQVREKV